MRRYKNNRQREIWSKKDIWCFWIWMWLW